MRTKNRRHHRRDEIFIVSVFRWRLFASKYYWAFTHLTRINVSTRNSISTLEKFQDLSVTSCFPDGTSDLVIAEAN